MDFVNRNRELALLDQLIDSKKGSLAVLWGRRRVGKTRLLLEWTKRHKGVYFSADESAASLQRKYFSLALDRFLPNFSEVEYGDWNSLLNRLAHDAEKSEWRGPIVIDELPYLIATSPELPSVLQKFIDHKAKQASLIIVICGSSQRMMQGAVLQASAPLYGRAEEILKLGPISPSYLKEIFALKSEREVIEYYAIWGGIPRYWELLERKKGNLLKMIEALVLDPMGSLYDEPNRLLLEELPPAITLRPILDAIGLGAHRLSEIAAKLGQPVTSLARPMQRLKELDLIEREVPFGTQEYSSKKALYKIKDPFLRFWFEVVAPKKSFLTQASTTTRSKWLKMALPQVFANSWEDLCRKAIPFLSLEADFIEAHRYWHAQGPEWDIISESVDKNILFVGEAKWYEKTPAAKNVHRILEEMARKGPPPLNGKHHKILYCLFVPEKPKKLKLPKGFMVLDAKTILNVMK